MTELTISKQQARLFLLCHHSLYPPGELEGKQGILDFIRRVGCIQFDPLNIVGRNPELVLQSRVGDFRPAMLDELLYKERRLLDGWDKQMSIYCVEDWPCFKRYREEAFKSLAAGNRPAVEVLPQIRRELEERGPLSSLDLEHNQVVDWWWAPTRLSRAALESMYHWGELIVHHKVNTRKVYDFASKHIPGGLLSVPDPNTTEEEYHDWHVLRRVGGAGLLWDRPGEAWLGMTGIKSPERKAAVKRLLAGGMLLEARVEGLNQPLYMRSSDAPRLDLGRRQEDMPARAAVIAPLDNMLWDRRLLKELFDFDYRWEVYKPEKERRYGYYVLPVLYGDRFIARFEPGRDKKSGALVIKNWWWEQGVEVTGQTKNDVAEMISRFMRFLGTKKLSVGRTAQKAAGLDWLKAAPRRRNTL